MAFVIPSLNTFSFSIAVEKVSPSPVGLAEYEATSSTLVTISAILPTMSSTFLVAASTFSAISFNAASVDSSTSFFNVAISA